MFRQMDLQFQCENGKLYENYILYMVPFCSRKHACLYVDWLQSLKQFFINVSYHILLVSLTLMALFLKQSHQIRLAKSI